MFGNQLFNSSFNSSPILPSALTEEDINFNGYGLQNNNVVTTDGNPEDVGQIEYSDFPIPNSNGSRFTSRYLRKKTFTIKGRIKGTDKDDAERRLDEFKKYIYNGLTAEYRYRTQGSMRGIKAKASNIVFPRKAYNTNTIPFSVTFTTEEPFWNQGSQSDIYEAVTANLSSEINVQGTADEVFPRVYVLFRTGITGTNTLSFTANNRTLNVSQTISDNDILVFDSEKRRVYYNGAEIDYTGTFPRFKPDANYFDININGTFIADITLINKINFV